MKSVIKIVNVTSEAISVGSINFPAGEPVLVYRNKDLFLNHSGKLSELFTEGSLVSYDFEGNNNTISETVKTISDIHNQLLYLNSGFSGNYGYLKTVCSELLDGFKKQIDAFDFTAEGVTATRETVIDKSQKVLTLLSVGFLHDATVALGNISPDTDADFLSSTKLGEFTSLFMSASSGF